MPVALAPTGLTGMQHADGEILAARAAAKAGVPFTLSTMSICSIEDVAENTDQPFWFQLYVMRDRDFIDRLIDRAKAAGCSRAGADAGSAGPRPAPQGHQERPLDPAPDDGSEHHQSRHQAALVPGDVVGTKRRTFRNIVGHAKGVGDLRSLSSWTAEQFDPTLSWDDVKRIKDRWGGKLILKGILDPEDAEMAAASGAEALIVSNHGGRQLDGAVSSIMALPAIASAVGDRIEVLMDGGIRSGQDVIKALALGAKGVFIGRAFLYGLGAGGEAGVTQCLDIIRKELDVTMALCGLRDVTLVSADILVETPYGLNAGTHLQPETVRARAV